MTHERTVWWRLALTTLAVVAALPLCASIPRGRATAYARDAVGRLTVTTYPSGRI